MKMSANENESVDIRLYANRRSNLLLQIDLEELNNRMERPSRVFSSRHHLSMPPALTDTNNMEQNEQFRRSRDISSSFFENLSSSTRVAGGTANGDAARNRSPFVRFTITDPETQQITAAGQIPLSNTPPNTQTSSQTSNNEVVDVSYNNDESDDDDDEPLNLNYWRNNIDPRPSYYSSMSHAIHQLRNSRSGRRSRRFTEHPYFIRNNLDNNPSNSRTIHRRVRFSSTNRGYNDHPLDRSQTPEQELPEVLEHVMEPDNQYDEVYDGQESISSVSSHNDADSGDERGSSHFSVSENHNTNADEENRDGTLDVSNETPRTRVVPFIMSPTPFSPPPESPPDTPEIPVTRINNDLLDATRPLPLIINTDDNHNTVFNNQSRATEETAPSRFEEHPETYVDLNDQLIRLFECPVCFEHIVPPIFQCLLGHLICNKCVLMCENCPTCRNPFNSKRNLYMEKVGYLVKFPCRNALTGCKQQMFVGQKEVHEKECSYRHYQCFFTNCAWKGYYPELHSHMINNHNNFILTGSEQSLDIMLPNNNQTYKWFLLSHCEYFAVIVHSSIPPRRVKIQVNFIGPAVKAKKFKFSVLLSQHKDRSDMSQKLMYERLTLPYSEIYEMSNNNGLKKDIFSLPGEVLEPFIKKRRRRLPIILKVGPVSGL
ncbi:E3 ubiquitin-protein ligase siah-1-like isoform X3 [Myzus persicae]|uniref:E3 ubiquitin-protein ligase siah-1-like isoform X3 n=1 Tax=Myzus persicae TaxID=13164 RepID=UPI000B9312B9|nr:E3 ubiquitin-protein ligase siah-1-like isoform X3 [Myzus persicae]